MIIKYENVPFNVEYDFDDDEVYLSSIKIDGHDMTKLLGQYILDALLDKVIEHLKKDNEESKFENAIDDWKANHD